MKHHLLLASVWPKLVLVDVLASHSFLFWVLFPIMDSFAIVAVLISVICRLLFSCRTHPSLPVLQRIPDDVCVVFKDTHRTNMLGLLGRWCRDGAHCP